MPLLVIVKLSSIRNHAGMQNTFAMNSIERVSGGRSELSKVLRLQYDTNLLLLVSQIETVITLF